MFANACNCACCNVNENTIEQEAHEMVRDFTRPWDKERGTHKPFAILNLSMTSSAPVCDSVYSKTKPFHLVFFGQNIFYYFLSSAHGSLDISSIKTIYITEIN
jgi:hypothetical protein